MRLAIRSFGVAGALVWLAACATPVPPTPTSEPSPQVATPSPSLAPSATPVPSPSLSCDSQGSAWTTTDENGSFIPVELTLTCGNAVAAAERVLPPTSAAITTIGFHQGGYCPPLPRKCAVAMPDNGYVVFTLDDGTTLWATVSAKNATVTATLQGPFPPA